uniref:hypothetical protein n=1 Tax=Thaumasiovibrio occultus TaxID=1891184 RepID=UPI000B35A029|nr:hypothetical protein [Thaumasiovibrio occultus]
MNATKAIGFALIAAGVSTLLYFLFNLSGYVQDFSSHPISEYLVGSNNNSYFISIDGKDITFSSDIMRFVALFFGFMLLKICIAIAASFIQAGRSLVVDDMDNVKKLINTLLAKKES